MKKRKFDTSKKTIKVDNPPNKDDRKILSLVVFRLSVILTPNIKIKSKRKLIKKT